MNTTYFIKDEKSLEQRLFSDYLKNKYKIIYDSISNSWYLYNITHWQKIDEIEVKRIISDELLIISEINKKLKNLNTNTTINSIYNILLIVCSGIHFNEEKSKIACKNGILNLEDLTVSEFDSDLYLNDFYDFNYSENEPKEFLKFLREILNSEDVKLLQKIIGAIIAGCNHAQKFLSIVGPAGGGKSTILNIIIRFIAIARCAQLRTSQLVGRFEMTAYNGKKLLYFQDAPSDFLQTNGSELVKSLTGGDYMQAEMKMKNERLNLLGNFHLIVTSNSPLRVKIRGDADAWARRMIVIFCKPRKGKRIADFAGKLVTSEGNEIFSWICRGAQLYLAELKRHGTITLTKPQKIRTESLLQESDTCQLFVSTNILHNKGAKLYTSDLFESYVRWCNAWEYMHTPKHKALPQLAEAILTTFSKKQCWDLDSANGTKVRGWRGLAVNNDFLLFGR